MLKKRDIISVLDLKEVEYLRIFKLADEIRLKEKTKEAFLPLLGKSIGLLFLLPSLRTKVSFEVGINQLGGSTISLEQEAIKPKRERIREIAEVLSYYLDCIIIRSIEHEFIEDFAKYANIPIINALSRRFHPCQILTDFYTILKRRGELVGCNLAFIGDGKNNIASSLSLAAPLLGINLILATPQEHKPHQKILEEGEKIAKNNNTKIYLTSSPQEAVENADIIYTDVWYSMGDKESKRRREIFASFQINKALLASAKRDYFILHCLPAHIGEEITEEVLYDKEHSLVWEQAKNQLIIKKAILTFLLGG